MKRTLLMIMVLAAASACETTPGIAQHDEPRQFQRRPQAAAKSDVAYRVAADADFVWNGHMASIWYPDLDAIGAELLEAGGIGDRITALNLQNAAKEQFKRNANWPTDDIEDAGMIAMVYYSMAEDRPEPPRVAPVIIETIEEERVTVKLDQASGATMVSAGGWQSMFAEVGVEVEITNTRTERRVEYPTYRVRNELKGYHVNIAVEAHYLDKSRRIRVGKPAMTGMAYTHSKNLPSDKRLEEITTELVKRMNRDAWKQSSKPRANEAKLKVAYRTAADADYIWNGHMGSIYYPDYLECGRELADLGVISDRIIAMNLQRAAKAKFKGHSNWPADKLEDAAMSAMIYYTITQDAPEPPLIVPVEVTVIDEERVQFKANSSFTATSVSASGWETLFKEAGVNVQIERRKATTETREEVIYTCDDNQPRGFHVTVAIEVYYLTGEGRRKKLGKSAQLGMAYWFSPTYPSDGKLTEATEELVTRMHKKAMGR